jgi:hypothetical protein
MSDALQEKVQALEQELAEFKRGSVRRGVRKRSEVHIGDMPLWDIAIGPDLEKNEVRGHARGFIAIGDIATGVIAMGGVARGFIAMGGVAIGGISLGGCAIGVLAGIGGVGIGGLALGGLAIGLVAIGGGAIGTVAIGGGAAGYYALGGGAFGRYTISAIQQDPEAIELFGRFIPGINHLRQQLGR